MARIGSHLPAVAVREALGQAVARLGPDRADADPGLRPLLIDLTDGAGREALRWVGMVTEVADLGIVIDLTDPERRVGAYDRICAETALSADAAEWVVETWCEALGVDVPAPPPPPPVPERVRAARPLRGAVRQEEAAPAVRPSVPLLPDGVGASRHVAPVTAAAVSLPGLLVATGAADGTVWLQSVDGRQAFACDAAAGGRVTTMAFSPEGRALATGSEDGVVRLWSTADGAGQGVLDGHTGGVTAVAVYTHRHGTMLAAGAADGKITLWSLPDGELLRQIGGHPDAVRTLAFRSGGRVLVSGGDDGAVRMWLSETGTRGHVLERGGPVGAVALSADGRYLAAADPAKVAVRRFAWPPSPNQISATMGQMIRGDVFFLTGAEVTDDHAGVRTLAFEPDGDLVAGGADDGTVVVWKPGAGADVGRAALHVGPVVTVAFTGGGSRLVSVGADGSVRFWRWRP